MTAEAAYQGAPASFSEQAARLFCGTAPVLLGCQTFDELFHVLATGLEDRQDNWTRFALIRYAC